MTVQRKHPRRQLFVDAKVQGALLVRMFVYGLLTCLTLFLALLAWQTVSSGPPQMFYRHLDGLWFRYGPVFVLLAMLMPIFAYDLVKLSNRFAGPMLRMRRAMRRLARGERVEPIVFRGNDFWRDFASDFNAVLQRVQPPVPTASDAPAQSVTQRRAPNERPAERTNEMTV